MNSSRVTGDQSWKLVASAEDEAAGSARNGLKIALQHTTARRFIGDVLRERFSSFSSRRAKNEIEFTKMHQSFRMNFWGDRENARVKSGQNEIIQNKEEIQIQKSK